MSDHDEAFADRGNVAGPCETIEEWKWKHATFRLHKEINTEPGKIPTHALLLISAEGVVAKLKIYERMLADVRTALTKAVSGDPTEQAARLSVPLSVARLSIKRDVDLMAEQLAAEWWR